MKKKKKVIIIISVVIGSVIGIYLFATLGVCKLMTGHTYFELEASSNFVDRFTDKFEEEIEKSKVINLAEIEQSDWDTVYFICIGYTGSETLGYYDGVDNKYNAVKEAGEHDNQIIFVKDKVAVKGYLFGDRVDLRDFNNFLKEHEFIKIIKVTRENAIFDIYYDENNSQKIVPTKDFEVFTYGEIHAQRDNNGNIIQVYE